MPDTHEITWGDAGDLKVDEHGRLYWKGQLVITRQVVKLEGWLAVAALVTAGSTFVLAVVGVLQLCGGH
jgi:hypothetical protein